MSRRYHTTGCGSPWVVAPDRGRNRNDGAKFVRPADEPPLWLGVLVTAFGLTVITAIVVCLSAIVHHSPGTSSANAPAEAQRASAIEVGKRKDSN